MCTQESSGTYHLAKPKTETIKRVNELWTEGWKVTIFTARGMNTCDGDVAEIELRYREMTEKWLKDNRVMYDNLIFGKPAADIYVDDKGLGPDIFTSWDTRAINIWVE